MSLESSTRESNTMSQTGESSPSRTGSPLSLRTPSSSSGMTKNRGRLGEKTHRSTPYGSPEGSRSGSKGSRSSTPLSGKRPDSKGRLGSRGKKKSKSKDKDKEKKTKRRKKVPTYDSSYLGESVLAAPRLDEPVDVPGEDAVMRAEREITDIARKLPRSMLLLQMKLKDMEEQVEKTHEKAVLPFQIRRAQEARRHLREEIQKTEHVIKELGMMSLQMQEVLKLRDRVKEETKKEMEQEIKELRKEKKAREIDIKTGYMNRISLLRLYWPWRQLLELGDTNVGATFKEELERGPRYRNVGIQNNVQSETTEQQLHWLEEISGREDMFRGHLSKLDALVDDLTDVTDLLESALTCSVCGLLFEDPILFWPCGHTFCFVCFQSLKISPSLHRCPTCSSISSEGYLHNIIVNESVAKWMFKDSGYGDLKGPMTSIRLHLSRFSRQNIQNRITQLRDAIKSRTISDIRGKGEDLITVSYRAY